MARTALAWPLGILITVLWGTLSLAGSLFDRSGRWAHRCMVTWSRWCLALARTRVEVTGLERIQANQPQVLAANHQSLLDIMVLAATLPVPFRFVAKRELFRLPFLGWHMSRAGFIAIDRDNPRQAARTLLQAAERIRSGTNAVVFPEGTRSTDGSLGPFRGGAFLLAIRAGVPVLPVAVIGTGQIIRKHSWTVRPATARVAIQPPIESTGWERDRDGLAARVRAEIERGLAQALDAEASGGA